MKFKEVILEKIDTLNENVEAVRVSMERHTVDPKNIYDVLGKVQNDLSQIKTLIKRENQD